MVQGRFEDLSQRLQATHIPLVVFDVQQEANRILVRRTMRVRELRELLIARFVEGSTSASEYAVYYEGRSLNLSETLAVLPANAQIRLGRVQRQQTITDTLILIFDRNMHFVIERLPMVIGRNKQPEAVDINLNDLPDGMTVSRRHALLLQQGNSYYVQNIAENTDRLLYVNDAAVNSGMMKELTDGALLRIGKINLTVRIHPKTQKG